MAALYTVIVADDEDELREAVCTMIPWEDYGFCLVGNASNGLDALQLVEKHEPDLLLTDIRMPFISGIELARQVREIRPATNIAFLSGYDDFEYAKQAIQYNIISYLLKPISAEELTVERIAASVALSESACLRSFRQMLGITPIQYVKQFRVEKAAELLRSTRLKTGEIGMECGFADGSYFIKTFREIKHCTPKEYRAKFC